jgi:hypothetical protein
VAGRWWCRSSQPGREPAGQSHDPTQAFRGAALDAPVGVRERGVSGAPRRRSASSTSLRPAQLPPIHPRYAGHPLGKRRVLVCPHAPWQIDSKQPMNVKRTFRRTAFLLSRLLGNMGVGGSTPVLARFHSPVDAARSEQRWLDGLYPRYAGGMGRPVSVLRLVRQGRSCPVSWLPPRA